MYCVYFIRNKETKKSYIGYTDNIKRRIKEHKNRKPELIYCEFYKSEIDARNRERKLKQRGQAVRRLKEKIKNSLIN